METRDPRAHDPRVDAYISARADFARPILEHVRALIHRHCPEAGEAIKWGFPHFLYKGRNLASIAAFKAHAAIGFWHGDAVVGGHKPAGKEAMGQLGRIASLNDLPDDAALGAMIERAMALIDSGAKPHWMEKRKPRPPLPVPPEFQAAIDADPAAAKVWAGFPPGHARDYVEWVSEAKRPETRDRRIAQSVEWIAQGKDRNWKYR